MNFSKATRVKRGWGGIVTMISIHNANISFISYNITTDSHGWMPLSLAPLNSKFNILQITQFIITLFIVICIAHLFLVHINFVSISILENPCS